VAFTCSAVLVACGSAATARRGTDQSRPSAPSTTTTTRPTTTTTAGGRVTSTTAPAGTERITYQPFVGSRIDPSLEIQATDSGRCLQYGGGAAGRYYYRCFGDRTVGGHISLYDPCFAGSQGTSMPLVCPSDPSTDRVVSFTATSVDASTSIPWTSTRPWAMRLSDGQTCLFVAAAWSGLGPYGCQSSTAGPLADCREPRAQQPWWTTSCQAQVTDTSPFTAVRVATVWF
jgi:hypothetical protein